MQLRSGRRSARLQRMIRSQVRRAFHGYCRKRTCQKTVMSGRIKAGFVILLNFRRRLIAFVALRCRFWCGPPYQPCWSAYPPREPYRGFESLPLRHRPLALVFSDGQSLVKPNKRGPSPRWRRTRDAPISKI